MKKVRLVTLLLLPIAFSACVFMNRHEVRGNGKQQTKNFDFKDFSQVDVSGAVNITLNQDSAYEVRLETDENLLPYLEVQVSNDDELIVKTKKGVSLNPSDQIDLYLSVPDLEKLSLSGASSVKTTTKFTQEQKIEFELHGASKGDLAVRAPEIGLEASGASTCTILGECRDIQADAQGASTINAFDLKSENANAEASGASTVRVFSSVHLRADASGASTIKYRGNPTTDIQSSGASSVGKDN